MSTLFRTKYPNQEQVVSGTYNVDDEDSVLKCNTSLGAVTINLLEIPSEYWNTLYKLYVVDNSGNAATNNITIVAPTGFTINNASSMVINVNGAGCIVRICADTKYTGALNYNPAGNTDTGWLDLQGFSWITTSTLVPQYRVINNQIFFRRNLVIPLVDSGGSVINYATDATYGTTYVNTARVTPFTGVGGVTTFTGGCYFNNGASVLQSAAHVPDANYESAWIIATKSQIFQAIPATPNAIGLYHSPYILTLQTDGVLKLETLKARELAVYPTQVTGNSILRYLNSNTITSSFSQNFDDVVDSMTTARTLNGSLITNYDFNQIKSSARLHNTTFNPAEEDEFGAMAVPLMNFLAYK